MTKAPPLKPAIIVGLSIAAFLGVMNFAILPGQKTTQNSNTTNTEIANWADCINAERQYSFSYPSDWKVWVPALGEARPGSCNDGERLLFVAPFLASDPGANIQFTIEAENFSDRSGTVYANLTSLNDYLDIIPSEIVSEHVLDGQRLVLLKNEGYFAFRNDILYDLRVEGFDDATLEKLFESFRFLSVETDATVNQNTNTTSEYTAGWKTYSNDTIGYSLQYSPEWKNSTCGYGPVWFGTQGVSCNSDAPTTDIIVTQLEASAELNTIIDTQRRETDADVTTIRVDGKTATRVKGKTKEIPDLFYGPGVYRDYVYVSVNGRIIQIGYFNIDGHEAHAGVFETILSTFTFTN